MMGLPEAKVEASNGGSAVDVEVSGERMGLLIGKRGDTLDAVQYLTSLYVNREKNSYIKVNIDTEGYRAKREETLIKLAHSLETVSYTHLIITQDLVHHLILEPTII